MGTWTNRQFELILLRRHKKADISRRMSNKNEENEEDDTGSIQYERPGGDPDCHDSQVASRSGMGHVESQ